MSAVLRFRTPTEDGAVLAHPPLAEIGRQLDVNRRALQQQEIVIDGTPLPEFRRLAVEEIDGAARQYLREAGEPVPDYPVGPLLLSGHQPELTHVGVLVKTFALNGLARRHGLTPLNLIVDNDTAKSTAMRLAVIGGQPGHPDDVHLLSLPYDRFEGEVPFEERPILDAELFGSVLDRATPATRNWGFTPILPEFWDEMRRQSQRTPILGEIVSATRRAWERRFGCHNLEIPLSRLCATNAFQRFARHLVRNLPRFHAIYNECVHAYRRRYGIRSRNHPVPDLERHGDRFEAPFWNMRKGQAKRGRLFVNASESEDFSGGPGLRSRALTTTMFARLILADGFIHGVGGAKYDEVTDAIVERWFGLPPPGIIVLTATLRLPLPRFPTTAEADRRAIWGVRDVLWNPQRHLSPVQRADPEIQRLVAEKERLIREEPRGKVERKGWFRRLSALTEQLRPLVASQLDKAREESDRCRREFRANELLMRRDYPWCLFPEKVLREFCQRLL